MTTYWISDICALFTSLNINPFGSKDKNKNFNALTRLIIAVTVATSIIDKNNFENIIIAGCISVLLSVLIYLSTYNSYSETEMYTENIKPTYVVSSTNKYNYNQNIHDLTSEEGLNNSDRTLFFKKIK